MTLETFYLVCFVAGFTFSVVSFFGGFTHGHLHLPKGFHLGHAHGPALGGHGGGHPMPVGGHAAPAAGHAVPGGHAGAAHGPQIAHGAHGAHAAHPAPAGSAARAARTAHFPVINPMTLAAFLTWFGGTGYLTEHRHWLLLTSLGVSSLAGMAGASVVFWFVGRVLMGQDYSMNPEDYDMVGVLGRLSVGIRENGTGELIYEQMGVRRVCAARSEIGERLEKGTEVIVTLYERGIAYVRRWEDLAGVTGTSPEQDKESSS